MYRESPESKRLMELNAYYIDNYKNKDNSIKNFLLTKLKNFWNRISDLRHIKEYGLKKVLLKASCIINPKKYINHTFANDFGHENEINYKPSTETKNGRIAVYTSIFGNYDSIVQPLFKSDKCDYFAITDQDIPQNGIWKKYDTSKIEGFEDLDAYHKSKFCKLFPHKLFPEYDYSLWLDGNVLVVADVYPLIDRLDAEHVMACFENYLHDCIYTEMNYIIYYNQAKTEEIKHQIGVYEKAGFPRNFGMREFPIIVRKHSDNELQSIMNEWWEHCNTYTMRDQISLPFILWNRGHTIDYIQPLKGHWRDNPRFVALPHNWRHAFK